MVTRKGITVRFMAMSDSPTISRIVSDGYADLAQQEGFSDKQKECLLNERATVANVQAWMRQWQCFVAELCGNIVGALAIERNDIAEIWVDRQHRGEGVGATLFRYAEQVIAEGGFQEVTARCAAVGARPFYESMGCELACMKPCLGGPLAGWPLAHYSKKLES